MSVTLPNGVTLPNNDGGIKGDYATVEKQVAADQTKLNDNVKALNDVFAKPGPLDAETAKTVAQGISTYADDANKFAKDHAYLMQIAEQDALDGKGNAEVDAATKYGEGTRQSENNIAQFTSMLENQKGLADKLGGPTNAAVTKVHDDVNRLVDSANEVGVHDTWVRKASGAGNTPVTINSPFKKQ